MSQQAAPSAAQGGAPVVEPTPGTPEYDAAMAAKADGIPIQAVSADGQSVNQVNEGKPPADPNTPADPNRPSWLPEKFKSVEDMAKAYQELEAKQGQKADQQEAPPAADGYNPEVHKKSAEESATEEKNYGKAIKSVFDTAGLKGSVLAQEFAEKGALPEYAYQRLEAAGYTKAVVDAYLNGLSGNSAAADAQAAQRTEAGYKVVGGEQNYKAMVDWARTSLSPAEIQAYNASVNGTPEQAALAVQGLQARYQASVGRQPTGLLGGSANAAPVNSGYASRAQVVQAMSDPRYESDTAYRQSVMDKLRVTPDSII